MLLKNRFICVVVLLASIGSLSAAAEPKVSTFAPAADLAAQADWYIGDLEKAVASEEEYKDSVEKIAKESNTLVIIALALGLHDEESKYKAVAGAVLKAAQAVAATKDFASAEKAVASLKTAAEGQGKADVELKCEKVAALPELMKQVPVISTKLKLNMKPAKFKKKAKDTAGYTAVLAVIAHGTLSDTSAAKNPEQAKQWRDFSAAARDHAGAANAAIHKGDQEAADAALKKLNQSCEDCHAVFKPDLK